MNQQPDDLKITFERHGYYFSLKLTEADLDAIGTEKLKDYCQLMTDRRFAESYAATLAQLPADVCRTCGRSKRTHLTLSEALGRYGYARSMCDLCHLSAWPRPQLP